MTDKTVPFGGRLITKEDAAAILPVVELIRNRALDDAKMATHLWDDLQQENARLRAENAKLREFAARYWAIRDALGDTVLFD